MSRLMRDLPKHVLYCVPRTSNSFRNSIVFPKKCNNIINMNVDIYYGK